ncbi:MAG: sigma-70 family RNA polymerase sigma factor [Bacteroidota bacterium]
MPTEQEILRRCQQGHAPSQEALYRRHWSFAMSVCLRYAPSREDALEVAHDAFLKAFGALGAFDVSRPFRPWFRQILVRCAIDHQRAARSRRRIVESEADRSEAALPETSVPPDAPSSLEADEILGLLRELPDTQRTVFNLYEVEGYSHDEIADLLGMATSASRSNLARAKTRLRSLYLQQIGALP